MSATGVFEEAAARGAGKRRWSGTEAFFRPLLESGLLLLCIRLAEPLLFGRDFYSSLDFHPFWIVVLLAGLQYGIYGGVTAAGLASLLLNHPPRPFGVDITDYYIELAALPLYWLVVALLVGGYRHVEIRRIRRLENELSVAQGMNDELAGEIKLMDNALAHAELTLATREVSDDERPHPTAVFNSLLELLHAPASRKGLLEAFGRAAATATALPAVLLLLDDAGRLSTGSDNMLPDLFPLPPDRELALLGALAAEQRAVVMPRSEIAEMQDGYVVAVGIRIGHSLDLAGAVLLFAEDQMAATAAISTAEILGIAASASLHSAENDDGSASDNVMIFPTGTR
jgi:hypothetical protein